jgi:hypothetical protein
MVRVPAEDCGRDFSPIPIRFEFLTFPVIAELVPAISIAGAP